MAALSSLVVAFVLLGLSSAMIVVGLSERREGSASGDRQEAFHIAQSGLSHAVANMTAGVQDDIGTDVAPIGFSTGAYFVDVADNGDDTFTLTSTGVSGAQQLTLQAVVSVPAGGLFTNAMFAGNSSGDPLYSLPLGGSGGQADIVYGDVYSGGDVDVTGDASATGTLRASGTVNGAAGEGGVNQGIPDLAALNYEANADFDVYDLFVTDPALAYTSDGAGGSAYQVPESNPAHIFRANPSDRSSEYGSTSKVDFFLEDPYEPVQSDSNEDGSDAYQITLAGTGAEPGVNGNNKTYFVDGNLWLHNKKSFSFMLASPEANGTQITFAVKGNIYFSDNLFYEDPDMDGVAFIALKDPNHADSGNIYFGDPEFGTLQRMYGYMYAENNFYDVNLDASGSAKVEVNGIMSAGNQVDIQRDHGNQHTKLTVNFDDRVATGALELPMLPTGNDGGSETVQILSWMVVPTN